MTRSIHDLNPYGRLVHATAEAVKRNKRGGGRAGFVHAASRGALLPDGTESVLVGVLMAVSAVGLAIVLGRWLDSDELNTGVHFFVRPLARHAEVAAMDEAIVATMAAATVVAMVVAKACEL